MALLPCAPMLVSDFDYELPEELIAQFPPQQRRASRLLAVEDTLQDLSFADLPGLLRAGDLLVVNDTRVIRARLRGQKETGGRVEVLIERVQNDTMALAQVRASKTPRSGSKLCFENDVDATVTGREGEFFSLVFSTEKMPPLLLRWNFAPFIPRRSSHLLVSSGEGKLSFCPPGWQPKLLG